MTIADIMGPLGLEKGRAPINPTIVMHEGGKQVPNVAPAVAAVEVGDGENTKVRA
jgi:hypothetical protein